MSCLHRIQQFHSFQDISYAGKLQVVARYIFFQIYGPNA
jgi:hypothetical protein